MKRTTIGIILLLLGAACRPVSAPVPEQSPIKPQEIVVYSGRKEALIKPVLDAFQEETNIPVRLKEGGTAELAALLAEEGERTDADVFIAQDAGTMTKLSAQNLLDKYDPVGLDTIPEDMRSPNGDWVGVSGRARALMANTTMVPAAEFPKTMQELRTPKWRDKVAMAGINEGSVVAWLEALIAVRGEEFALDLLQGYKTNGVKVLKDHEEVAAAVGRGEFAIGIVNQYYVYLEKEEHGTPVEAFYPDQGEGDMGTLVNAASAGLVKGASPGAKKLIDFLLTKEAQQKFAEQNYEYPLAAGVSARSELKPLTEIKRMQVNLSQLGQNIEGALKVWDESGIDS